MTMPGWIMDRELYGGGRGEMLEGGYKMDIPAGCSHGGRVAECCRGTLVEAVGLN